MRINNSLNEMAIGSLGRLSATVVAVPAIEVVYSSSVTFHADHVYFSCAMIHCPLQGKAASKSMCVVPWAVSLIRTHDAAISELVYVLIAWKDEVLSELALDLLAELSVEYNLCAKHSCFSSFRLKQVKRSFLGKKVPVRSLQEYGVTRRGDDIDYRHFIKLSCGTRSA